MHTLDCGLNFVFMSQGNSSTLTDSTTPCNTCTTWPCPGLTRDIHLKIESYLLRTTVPSAGSTSIKNIALDMYNKAYKDLTKPEKQAVHGGQTHTHQWALEHQQRHIFAIGIKLCLHKVSKNTGNPQPCDACSALLKDCAFWTATFCDISEDENHKFTPHLYQAAEIAKISAKHSGLGAIFDKVSPLQQIQSDHWVWNYRMPLTINSSFTSLKRLPQAPSRTSHCLWTSPLQWWF